MLDEAAQELELQARQIDGLARAGHLGAPEVDADVAKGEAPGRPRLRALSPAQHRLDAGQQLHHVERLGEVVVGAQLESQHAVDDLASGGEHQDGGLHLLLAQVPKHVEAAPARERDVQQDEVERAFEGALETRVSVLCALHLVASRPSPRGPPTRPIYIPLRAHEDSHRFATELGG